MLITLAPQLLYRCDSARVENCGPPCTGRSRCHEPSRHSHALRCQIAGEIRAHRIGQRNVNHQAVSEKRLGALEGTIDKLIRYHQLARMNFLFQTARGGYRNQMRHAELLHPENVGAKMYFRWQQSMAATVTREENHLDVPDASLVKRIDGRPNGVSSSISSTLSSPFIW